MIPWVITWLKAARAPFLVVSLMPVCVGAAIAASHGKVSALFFTLVLVGVLMAQSAADFIDDYFDFRMGNFGNKEKQFHDSPLLDGKITPAQVLSAGVGCLLVSLAVGVWLLVSVGTPVLYLSLAGGFIAIFYTSPPVRLNYRGFGEVALFVAFGPLLVVGVNYVLTGRLSWESALAAVPLGVFTMNLGIVSHTFDYESDVEAGKMSLVVRYGQANAVRIVAVGSALAYVVLVAAVAARLMPAWSLLALVTAPLAAETVRGAAKYADKSRYLAAMSRAIALTTLTGVLLCVGYLIA
jgi:1,4-dihydroxy-2-naphthoate polyprenyltransferase